MNETNEFKEIDLNQLQKVEVRDNSNQLWEPAYLLQNIKWHDHPYKVLYELTDCEIWRGEFKQCRPYKEPTKRPMTHREIFNALKKEDCWLRWPETTKNQFCAWNAQWIAEEYEITYDGGETWHKLEVEDD